MVYRPSEPRSLWGFWIIEWKDEYHLFYDEDIDTDFNILSWQKRFIHVGHAVSKDLIRWETRSSLSVQGEPGTWNEMVNSGMKTGCIAHHQGKFYMFVGAHQADGVQVIGLWMSDDLEEWEEYPENPVIKPAGPHYLYMPTEGRASVSWRDPGIFYSKKDDSYHMCISAMENELLDQKYSLGSVIAHIRSKDLIHWEHLPPFDAPELLERFYQNEEAEIFEHNGRHYLIFDGGTTGGMRTHTAYRDDTRGSFYMMSSDLEGPYTFPDDALLIGNDMGARCATTGRVIPYKGGYAYVHFSIARRPAIGTPKKLFIRTDGSLQLKYLPVLEKMESAVICGRIDDLPHFESVDTGRWQRSSESLSCKVGPGGSVYRVVDDVSDFHLVCSIKGTSAVRAGVVIRISPEGDAAGFLQGVGIILDFEKQQAFVADANAYAKTGWYCSPLESCRLSLSRKKTYRLRCFAREEHLEVYLNDNWVFTTVLPDRKNMADSYRRHYRWGPVVAASGAIELMAEDGEAVYSELRLATLEPLA